MRKNGRKNAPADAAPPDERATLASVAKLAGVSETTVSLAFQPGSRISGPTRARVLDVARRLRYVPNRNAQSLRAGRTRLVGLLVNDLANPFYGQIAEIAETAVEARGYHLLVFNSRWSAAREGEAVRRMAAIRVEGALVCLSETAPDTLPSLRDAGIPAVALDMPSPDGGGAFVANDLDCAGRLAAAHLAGLGCRRPALVFPSAESFSGFRALEEGFRAAWSATDGREPPVRAVSELTLASGAAAFLELHRRAPGLDAVCCGNDLSALGVMDAADQLGLRVGEELAVMGVDDLPVSAMARLGLTSLREPVERLAARAAEALLDGLERREAPTVAEWLAPELVARASTLRFQRGR